MQLKKSKSIRGALATATCALLGTQASQPAMASLFEDWQTNSAVLYYSEQDRVTAVEPVIKLKRDLGNDAFLDGKFVADILSGSSPTGAVPTNQVQTFAGPSGTAGYTVNANETPLDPNFQDQRFAFNASLEKPQSRDVKTIFGGNFSTETDYNSLGGSASMLFDFNNKNTTLSTSFAFNLDSVTPIGGAPQALSDVPTVSTVGGNGGEGEGEEGVGSGKTKTVTDILFGVTQILSRQTLTQFNIGIGRTAGYLNDPYKMLSVVIPTGSAAGTLEPDPANPTLANHYHYVFEKRPDTRNRRTLYWKLNHQFNNDVVYLTYRYYSDDWGIKSQTTDLRYRFEFGRHQYLQPHVRYYKQTAADFYHYFLLAGDPLPQYASADYRLGALTTKTIGLEYGYELRHHGELNFRIEKMTQTGDSHPSQAVGILKNYDLFPTVNAIILQLNYNYKF